MTSVRVAFVLIFAVVQLCTAEYVVYGSKMTLGDNLSLNPNQFHHHLLRSLEQAILNIQVSTLINFSQVAMLIIFWWLAGRFLYHNLGEKFGDGYGSRQKSLKFILNSWITNNSNLRVM